MLLMFISLTVIEPCLYPENPPLPPQGEHMEPHLTENLRHGDVLDPKTLRLVLH